MKSQTNTTTSKYGFIAIVFLVLALSCLIFLMSSYSRDSSKLDATVNNLSHNNSDEEKIDSALSLLYIAENDARMYSLYRDKTYYTAYSSELQKVKSLIDSLKVNDAGNSEFGELVADKELKTKLFLKAQSIVDSILLTHNDTLKTETPKKINHKSRPRISKKNFSSSDTTLLNTEISRKKTKGFFGRLSDAILNKQDTSIIATNTILINNYKNDSIRMNYENLSLKSQVSDLQNHQKELDDLKSKERAVLEANHNLFLNLQDLLQDLKKQETKLQEKRNSFLSRNAFSLTKNLKVSNAFITGFSALLALVILIILFFLYKNELALKKAKLQAENYAKLKSEFTATMSHEIRTPLHSIHAFADELNVHHNKHHQSEIIDAIKLSSRMLLSVVNNILDFTKIEKGKFKLEHVAFNPKNIINEIISGLKIQAKQKNLELSGFIDNSTDRNVYGDAFHLRQILLNIISNSIKYTNQGNVRVNANIVEQSPQKVVLKLTVADTGVGIAQEDIPNLFDEFSSNTHQKDITAGSSGLGLNIVKKMVDLHKGKISVTSTPNEGSVFTIEIPYDIVSTKKQESNNDKAAKLNIDTLKVLLVENDKFNQKFLSQLFKKQNVVLEMATSAESALSVLKEKKFDLILTDISLPKMNGIDLVKNIREKDEQNRRTKIFGLTGFEKTHAENNLSLFDEWMVKPFKSQDLIDKINQHFPRESVSEI